MIPRHLLILLVLLPSVGGGCVALNLPSERYDDPDVSVGQRQGIDALLLWAPHRGGSLPADHGDPPLRDAPEQVAAPHEGRLPSVPWPRFHPIPTRPVY